MPTSETTRPRFGNAYIAGVGAAFPPEEYYITIAQYITKYGLEGISDPEFIKERTLANGHYESSPDYPPSRLAQLALKQALESAQLEPGQIDGILLAEVIGDSIFPDTSDIAALEIGCKRSFFGLDVSGACCGFVQALDLGSARAERRNKRMAVIGVGDLTKISDHTKKNWGFLFGSGAGAVILDVAEDAPCSGFAHYQINDRSKISLRGGTENTLLPEPETDPNTIEMDAHGVGRYASIILPRVIKMAALETGLYDQQKNCVDWLPQIKALTTHQPNGRAARAIARGLWLPDEMLIETFYMHGNISSGSVPDAIRRGVDLGIIGGVRLNSEGQPDNTDRLNYDIICVAGVGASMKAAAGFFPVSKHIR